MEFAASRVNISTPPAIIKIQTKLTTFANKKQTRAPSDHSRYGEENKHRRPVAGGDYISHSSDKSDLTSTQSHFQFGADMLAMIGIVESRKCYRNTNHILVLIPILMILVLIYLKFGVTTFESFSKNSPPGPKPWPIIGSLHLMASYTKYPFEVFTRLQKVSSSSRIIKRTTWVPNSFLQKYKQLARILCSDFSII